MTVERHGRLILAAFFILEMVALGPGVVATGVMFPAWIREFHWSRAEVAWLAFASSFTAGMLSPLVGMLVDRIGARGLIAVGLVINGLAFLALSYAHSLRTMIALYAVVGVGLSLAGFIPLMVVIVNWFKRRSGMATGVFIFGLAAGMTLAPPILTWIITHWGWRTAMRWMSAPILLIALPIVLMVVRTRPPTAELKTVAEEVAALPGLELHGAIRTSTFWLLMIVQTLYSLGSGEVLVHQITYLIGVGYPPERSALIFSSQTAFSGFGVLLYGAMADRFGARSMLSLSMLQLALGIVALMGAGNPHYGTLAAGIFVFCWGLPAGAVNPLIPILTADT